MDPICEVWQSAYVIPVIIMEWNRHTALSHIHAQCFGNGVSAKQFCLHMLKDVYSIFNI